MRGAKKLGSDKKYKSQAISWAMGQVNGQINSDPIDDSICLFIVAPSADLE